MADRRAARSSSRRTTPQSPAKSSRNAAPVRKSTRRIGNRSHNISDSDLEITNAQIGSRLARQATVESQESTSSGDRRIRNGNRARPRNDLPTVAESPNITYPRLSQMVAMNRSAITNANDGDAVEEQIQREALTRRDTRSPGRFSTVSGISMQTPHSAQELADLDQGEMLENLPDLYNDATGILEYLVPPGASENTTVAITNNLKDETSKARRRLMKIVDRLQISKENFGSEPYINVSIVIRGLLGVRHERSVSEGPWRPDLVLQKANLASMIAAIFSSGDALTVQSSVDKIERDFPTPFLSRFVNSRSEISRVSGSSALLNETFEVALDLRTQSFIGLFKRFSPAPNFSPEDILEQLFFEGPKSLRGWDVPGLQGDQLSKMHMRKTVARLGQIKECLPNEEQDLSAERANEVERLVSAFGWTSFLVKTALWCRMRLGEIDEQIKLQRGIQGIVEALEDEITKAPVQGQDNEAVTDSDNSQVNLSNYAPPSDLSHPLSDQAESRSGVLARVSSSSAPVRKFDSPGIIRHVFQRIGNLKATGQNSSTARTVQPITPTAGVSKVTIPSTAPPKISNDLIPREEADDEWQAPPIEEEEGLMDAPLVEDSADLEGSSTALESREIHEAIVDNHSQSQAQSNKENNPALALRSREGSKRRAFIDWQPGAERVTFDNLDASQDTHRIVRGAKRSSVDAGIEQGDEESISQDEGFQNDNRPIARGKQPAKRSRTRRSRGNGQESRDDIRTVVTQEDDPPAPPSTAQIYKQVNSQAKVRTAQLAPKKPQTRKPWTDEEVQLLIDLIENHGTSWALLKSIDFDKNEVAGKNILRDRDQVALKDKARNMRVDYLKNNVVMPRNFDLVPLSKLQKEKLDDLGIEY